MKKLFLIILSVFNLFNIFGEEYRKYIKCSSLTIDDIISMDNESLDCLQTLEFDIEFNKAIEENLITPKENKTVYFNFDRIKKYYNLNIFEPDYLILMEYLLVYVDYSDSEIDFKFKIYPNKEIKNMSFTSNWSSNLNTYIDGELDESDINSYTSNSTEDILDFENLSATIDDEVFREFEKYYESVKKK